MNVPDSTDATTPPTATADRNNPSVRGSLPKRSALTSGNRLIGMESTVVARSVTSAARTTGFRARNASPSSAPRSPGRDTVPSGRIAGSPNAPYMAAQNVTASRA